MKHGDCQSSHANCILLGGWLKHLLRTGYIQDCVLNCWVMSNNEALCQWKGRIKTVWHRQNHARLCTKWLVDISIGPVYHHRMKSCAIFDKTIKQSILFSGNPSVQVIGYTLHTWGSRTGGKLTDGISGQSCAYTLKESRPPHCGLNWLDTLVVIFFNKALQKLVQCHNKCLHLVGEYMQM